MDYFYRILLSWGQISKRYMKIFTHATTVRVMCIITFAHILSLWDNFQSAAPPPNAKIYLIFMKNDHMFQMIWQSVFCWIFDLRQVFHACDGLNFCFCALGFKRSIQSWIYRIQNNLTFYVYIQGRCVWCCLTLF